MYLRMLLTDYKYMYIYIIIFSLLLKWNHNSYFYAMYFLIITNTCLFIYIDQNMSITVYCFS